jgi:NADPH:quinone reductase-like Zn-dependent oxidoreductase
LVSFSDWKHVAFKLADPDCISGCDYVGQAIEIGSEVPKEVKGSVRLGFVRGGKSKTIGAFSEYIKQEYDLTAEVPKNISPAQAASAPIPCMWQCMRSLYMHLLTFHAIQCSPLARLCISDSVFPSPVRTTAASLASGV